MSNFAKCQAKLYVKAAMYAFNTSALLCGLQIRYFIFMEAELNVNIVGDRTPLPGPADYVDRDRFGEDANKWTIRPRVMPKERRLDPALVNLKSTIGDAPKYTMVSRHPEPNKFVPPGPNYVPPPLGKDAPKVGFTRARDPNRKDITPGPADYVATPKAAKAFGTQAPSVHVREGGPRQLWGTVYSPGPACYKPRYNASRGDGPKWTIGHKYNDRKRDRTGEYVKQTSSLGGSKFTFARAGRPQIMHR